MNNKGATKISKRLGNYHNYGELRHWAWDCKKNPRVMERKK
jgi:hypothetical protein